MVFTVGPNLIVMVITVVELTDTLTLTIEDAAGNSVTSSINISITSDNILPTISNLTVSTSTVNLYSLIRQKLLLLVLI